MIPRKIGRYEIKTELGRGGMATVFRAYDPHFQRDVALKILPREFLHDPSFRARFEREAQTVAQLDHPAIVPVHDFGQEDGQPYLVMRYLSGGTLTQRLRQGEISFSEVIRIIDRLAPALDEAHKLGIVHRDLKPDNILFDHRNDPFITDFGIAKLSEGSGTLTTSGLIIGTPAYMSPEQANGDEIDGRSDIYALGVILFQMLTGRLPYEADAPISLIIKHLTEPVPDILEVKPDLPPGCQIVIAQAMAKERDRRYATATALATALVDSIRMNSVPKRIVSPQPAEISAVSQSRSPSIKSGSEKDKPIICPKCQTSNPGHLRLCSKCGYRLTIDCIMCHTPNRVDATYCVNCKTDLQESRAKRRALSLTRRRAQAKQKQAFQKKEIRQNVQKLLDDLEDRKTRPRALYQLNQLDHQTFDILINDLFHDDPETRYNSAKMLAQICYIAKVDISTKTQIIEALTKASDDLDPKVSQEAQEALQKIDSKGSSNMLTGLMSWLKGS